MNFHFFIKGHLKETYRNITLGNNFESFLLPSGSLLQVPVHAGALIQCHKVSKGSKTQENRKERTQTAIFHRQLEESLGHTDIRISKWI